MGEVPLYWPARDSRQREARNLLKLVKRLTIKSREGDSQPVEHVEELLVPLHLPRHRLIRRLRLSSHLLSTKVGLGSAKVAMWLEARNLPSMACPPFAPAGHTSYG